MCNKITYIVIEDFGHITHPTHKSEFISHNSDYYYFFLCMNCIEKNRSVRYKLRIAENN